MNAIAKTTIEPHFAHFAQRYRLRASGSRPALTNNQNGQILENPEQATVGHLRRRRGGELAAPA